MKIAIIVGHNSRAQGAVRVTDGRSEFDWNGELAGLIQSHDPDAIRAFRREPVGGCSAEINRVCMGGCVGRALFAQAALNASPPDGWLDAVERHQGIAQAGP